MSSNIAKTEGVLLDAARDLQTTYGEVTSDILRMRDQLESLQSQWVGRGGQTFQHLVVTWQRKADQVLACLEDFKEQLTAAETTYDMTEDSVRSVFRNYAGSLG